MSKGLMRKTKQELVDIILRKDDVEVQLQKQVKACQDELEQVKQINQNYSLEDDVEIQSYNSLKEERTELAQALAEKEETIIGLEDLVETHNFSYIMQLKRSSFYKNLSIFLIIIIISELLVILKLMF